MIVYKNSASRSVGHLSDLATEREIHEFFSFSGDIEYVEICLLQSLTSNLWESSH
ncbi:Nucleotide-binding, alpha-beta plait [Artemisia annua]|uniref:Nucleotide-binding, alpha-beta plait n=1 Tax=Artemisia annua TaxID=35608 RepID=A0A2U1P1C0_ARTAN|nr:Nucleotide-binding, alpha-beta plait [Artemisia annua]